MERARAVAILVVDEQSMTQGDMPVLLDSVRVLVSVRRTSAQIALPGGKVETRDASLSHAAARELQEETGLTFPAEDFAIEHTLHQPDWIITLVSVVCAVDRQSEVRNMEPEKHGPWTWRAWQDLKNEASENVFAPLRVLLEDVTTISPVQR